LSPTLRLCAVVADRFDRATFHCFLAGLVFFGILGLLHHEGKTAVGVAGEILRGSFAAQVAVDALVVHVVFARHVLDRKSVV
jgi:hypothetical protein